MRTGSPGPSPLDPFLDRCYATLCRGAMRTPFRKSQPTIWAAILVVSIVCALVLVASFVAATGTDFSSRIRDAVSSDSLAEDVFEILSFVAVIFAAVVAVVALVVARQQWMEAERARYAQILLDVSNEFISPNMEASKRRIRLILHDFDAFKASSALYSKPGDYINFVMQEFQDSKDGFDNYSEIIRILYFFENTSLLARRGHFNWVDLYFLIGPSMIHIYNLFFPYIRDLRSRRKDQRLYEHLSSVVATFLEFEATLNEQGVRTSARREAHFVL